ncbi:hypothetical protein C725_2808 [Pacificimonas flava]|uniref:Methyltransferase domain-containing protein n=1 Tax=Pacificimonas flava TaxID=1234595 RepID=M2TJK6_9SPHN|nr:hypothetical protein C725_2808 [Pacificimonas flava]
MDQARFWDDRFASDDYVFGTEPNAFLKREIACLPAGGRVLAVADGEGRNGVYLAQQGFDVVATDISFTGIAKARRLASERGVTLTLEQVDLAQYAWPDAGFDAVVAIFVQFADPALRASMFAGFAQTLRPGGILMLEGYRPEQLEYGTGGPPHEQNMYTEDLLRTAFADWDVLALDSYDADIREGSGHGGMSALIDLVACKPD